MRTHGQKLVNKGLLANARELLAHQHVEDALAAESNRSRNEIINILLENSADNAEIN